MPIQTEPCTWPSTVSRLSALPAIEAAQNLKAVLIRLASSPSTRFGWRTIAAAAARKLEAKPDAIECLGELYRAGAQDKGLTFSEVVTEALKDIGTITVTGNYSTIPQSHGGKKYRGAAIGGSMGYSYSAQVVEVTVDEEGLMVTANMLDYRVPTIQDSPPIEVGIVESVDPHGPFGAKEAGEGSLAAFLPALTNAIADATGLRFNNLPVTPDRVFAALEKRTRNGGHS
jgi:4-hydroxybenzoyl-CoA reductase subunit alpha